MVSKIKQCLPEAHLLFVLDRDPGESEDILHELGVDYLLKKEGWGFDAAGARELGAKAIHEGHAILFLDGDRIPMGDMSHSMIEEALARFDVTYLKVNHDFRTWFSQDFVKVPVERGGPIPYKENTFLMGTFTCGMLMSSDVRRYLFQERGEIFSRYLRGRYGEEDNHLGAILLKEGFNLGGFPHRVYLSGALSLTDEDGFLLNREKYRILLQDEGYLVSRPKVPLDTKSFLREVGKGHIPLALGEISPPLNRPIYIYYHVYQGGDPDILNDIVQEQLAYIQRSSLWGRFNRLVVVTTHGRNLELPSDPRIEVRRGKGSIVNERMTLQEMYRDMQGMDAVVLYWHTKGATSHSRPVTCWRRFLMEWTVSHWEEDAMLLLRSQGAVGPIYSHYPWGRSPLGNTHFFAGNFWWSKSEHIRGLIEPFSVSSEDRFVWEGWITSKVTANYMCLKKCPVKDAYKEEIEGYL